MNENPTESAVEKEYINYDKKKETAAYRIKWHQQTLQWPVWQHTSNANTIKPAILVHKALSCNISNSTNSVALIPILNCTFKNNTIHPVVSQTSLTKCSAVEANTVCSHLLYTYKQSDYSPGNVKFSNISSDALWTYGTPTHAALTHPKQEPCYFFLLYTMSCTYYCQL